jgi:hypothetical protein
MDDLNTWQRKILLCFPTPRSPLRSPHCAQFFLRALKQPDRDTDHSPTSIPRLRMQGTVPPRYRMPSRRYICLSDRTSLPLLLTRLWATISHVYNWGSDFWNELSLCSSLFPFQLELDVVRDHHTYCLPCRGGLLSYCSFTLQPTPQPTWTSPQPSQVYNLTATLLSPLDTLKGKTG